MFFRIHDNHSAYNMWIFALVKSADSPTDFRSAWCRLENGPGQPNGNFLLVITSTL